MSIVPTPGHPMIDIGRVVADHAADGTGIVVQFANRYGHDLGTWEGPVSVDAMLLTDAADVVLTEHGYRRTSVWRYEGDGLTAPVEVRDRANYTETPEQTAARRARDDAAVAADRDNRMARAREGQQTRAARAAQPLADGWHTRHDRPTPPRHAVGTLDPDGTFTLTIGVPVRYSPGTLTDLHNGAPWFGTLALGDRFDRALDVALAANGWERSGPWERLDGGARLSAPVLRTAERQRRDAAAAQVEREAAATRFAVTVGAAVLAWVCLLLVVVDLSDRAGSDLADGARQMWADVRMVGGWVGQALDALTPRAGFIAAAVLAYVVAFAALAPDQQRQRRCLGVVAAVFGSLAAAGAATYTIVLG